ncbi:hypothetical protein [Sodalis glossinidius]|uniref:hypothetical protein n=1 Tax=Sodalis glossinidius TaxID=63612 RepID=UPI00031ECE99
MIPELGNFLLCLGAGLALLLSVYPLWGASRQDARMMAVARPLTYGVFIALAGAFACLVQAFSPGVYRQRFYRRLCGE